MKNLIFTGTILAASMLLSACDPKPRSNKPARGNAPREPEEPTEITEYKPKTERIRTPKVDVEDSTPSVDSNKPETKPVPPPSVANPEYGKKSEGKPGFIESPYSAGKLIDVRGLPPGTEIECPYTRRPLLVP